MKNSILTIILASLFSLSSHAEAWFKTEIGINAWSHDIKLADATPGKDVAQNFHLEMRQYLYVFVPHIAFDYAAYDATLAGFKEMKFSAFYHALKNEYLFLNLGISYNDYRDGYIYRDSYLPFSTSIIDFFAQSQVIIPRTNFSIGGKVHFSGEGKDRTSGYTAELRYRLIMNRLLLSFKGGYSRSDQSFAVDQNTSPEVTFAGPFLGASVTL